MTKTCNPIKRIKGHKSSFVIKNISFSHVLLKTIIIFLSIIQVKKIFHKIDQTWLFNEEKNYPNLICHPKWLTTQFLFFFWQKNQPNLVVIGKDLHNLNHALTKAYSRWNRWRLWYMSTPPLQRTSKPSLDLYYFSFLIASLIAFVVIFVASFFL